MPENNSISILVKGMVTDIHTLNRNSDSYSFALNAMVSDMFSGNELFLQNEGSNTCSVAFPVNHQVVGNIEIPELKRTIYFLKNLTTGNDQIGEVINCNYQDSTDIIEKSLCLDCGSYKGTKKQPFEDRQENCYCQYRMIVANTCLNFNVNYPVDIEYKITNCSLQLYFTDNYNERRFIYFNFEDDKLTNPLVLQDAFKVTTYSEEGTCDCPSGYTYNDQTETCYSIDLIPFEPSGDLRTACAATSNVYGTFGVAIYSTGFNVNGTGASTTHHAADTFWSNPSSNYVDGRLNHAGLWACDASGSPQGGTMYPINEDIGFLFSIDVPETKTYYVGIAGDNKVKIKVDCTTIMDMDPSALDTQYGGTLNAFKYWHIYPITLSAGYHVVELTGYNTGSIAGFGAEIYNNTSAEIAAATGGTGLDIIFSTYDKRGDYLQVSASYSGDCPSGCVYIDASGSISCAVIDEIPADCDECAKITYTNELDCNKLRYHPEYDKPCIDLIGFVNGGNLKAGTYQVLVCYADYYGNPMSNYFPSTNTAPLFENQITFETNYETNKALRFTISGLKQDTLFQYYNIVIAKTVDNFTEYILVGTFDTTKTEYIYTGFEKAAKVIPVEQVFFRFPFYEKAKGVTKANNYLQFTGVTEYKELNLQRVANNVLLKWQTVALKEGAYREAKNNFYFRGYMRDEVYAMGIIFEFDNARETCAYHVPGREAVESDLDIIANDDVLPELTCDEVVYNRRWQLYNTATVLGGDYEYNDNCELDKCWEYGDFAYWESTETYPNIREVWGDLCGQPIRHHKFPDSCVTHIHDASGGSKTYDENNYIFPIGVKVDHQSVIDALDQAVTDGVLTQSERDSITGYRIVRGNRVGNKSVDAKGLIFNMWKYTKSGEDFYYPNYPYNDLRDDDYLAPDDTTYDGSTTSPPDPSSYYGGHDRFTFHSPDVHFINSSIGNILKIETEEYGESEGYFTHSDCQAKHKFLSTVSRSIALGFGVAAALSATGEKECKVITKKANLIQQPYSVNSNGQIPYGNVTGASPGATTTIPAFAAWNGTTNMPQVIVGQNNAVYTTYDPTTGLPIGVPVNGADEQITTCKGQAYQLFNANLVVNTILAAGGAGLGLIIQKVLLGIIEADKFTATLKTLVPWKNYSTQYNSIANYNNYNCVGEGNKLRYIEKSAYLRNGIQSVDEPSANPADPYESIKINNWNRESSVYLKIPSINNIDAPSVIDDSRFTMDEEGLDYDELNKLVYRTVSSYYVGLKRQVLNQYGQICDIEYLETNSCVFKLDTTYDDCEATVFGGDTYINRFGLKRKMPFFLHTMCKVQDGTDVRYSELGNAAFPNYYFDTEKPFFERFDSITDLGSFFSGATLQDIIGTNDTRLDAKTSKFFYQNGYAHLFSYGIPYFLVESDVNVDYRHGENNKEKDFYPHNSDLKTWLEEENVPISEDNYYFYNRTYSKQNKETPICTSCIKAYKDLFCDTINYNRIIYSEPTDTETKNDNWLIFRANNYHDFPLSLGKLITADGIENDKVLVRFEQGFEIYNAYNTIQTTGENIYVGTGGMFQTRPQNFAITKLGHAGSQHRAILNTEYGHIWADSVRGQVFNLGLNGSAMDDLSEKGMENWFKENLPFQVLKDFDNIPIEDIDNNLNGLGLHFCYDKRFKRFILTKLDYKKIDSSVQYDADTKTFYVLVDDEPVTVSLKNPKYFCNKSWTISYSFKTKSWTAFHTYKPELYVQNVETFDSIYKRTDTQKLYTHNVTNKSYQVFYGRLNPFVIEFITKQSLQNNYLTDIKFSLDVIRYHNEFDTFYDITKTFNKAIVYNNYQCSGLLHLVPKDPEDLSQDIDYPKRVTDGYEILVTNSEYYWNFNTFWDVVRDKKSNVPIFNYDCNNADKTLNSKALNYAKIEYDRPVFKQKMATVRLINDKESQYKFVFTVGLVNQMQSFR